MEGKRFGSPEARKEKPFIVARGEVINHDHEASPRRTPADEISPSTLARWGGAFTTHALERMEERKITPQQVWAVIQSPKKIRRCPPKKGESRDRAQYTHAGIRVVVNEPERAILTVGWAKEPADG